MAGFIKFDQIHTTILASKKRMWANDHSELFYLCIAKQGCFPKTFQKQKC